MFAAAPAWKEELTRSQVKTMSEWDDNTIIAGEEATRRVGDMTRMMWDKM